jgi:hypothetical protein
MVPYPAPAPVDKVNYPSQIRAARCNTLFGRGVVPNVSWGTLSSTERHEWVSLDCDNHIEKRFDNAAYHRRVRHRAAVADFWRRWTPPNDTTSKSVATSSKAMSSKLLLRRAFDIYTPLVEDFAGPSFDSAVSGNDPDALQPGETSNAPIVLYRLLGNDLPPLEGVGQIRRNTAYALANEPKVLPGGHRRWILNRIANATEHRLIKSMLAEHGYADKDVIDIPFNRTALCGDSSGRQHQTAENVMEWGANPSTRAKERNERSRNSRISNARRLYATHQNGARNEAFRMAQRDGFRWILVFDGNGFLTAEAWAGIADAAMRAERDGR